MAHMKSACLANMYEALSLTFNTSENVGGGDFGVMCN
jgi:hypothetical protein